MAQDKTPKQEMLARLLKIVEGLRAGGHATDAHGLSGVVASLRRLLPRDATIQEVLVRTLQSVVDHGVTLDGRLVDVLSHLAVQYGVTFSMHPLLVLIGTFGSTQNPDRADSEKSTKLDALLSVIMEQRSDYQSALYTLAVLARQQGLTETSDMAAAMLEDLHQAGAGARTTQQEQAETIQTAMAHRPEIPQDDDLGWVVKIMLTLASVAAVVAMAGKLAGGIKEILGSLDEVLGLLDIE